MSWVHAENGPAFQRRDQSKNAPSPGGTTDFLDAPAVPAGLGQCNTQPGVKTPGYCQLLLPEQAAVSDCLKLFAEYDARELHGYAELQALERKPMTMRDWIAKLDDFLKASGRELLKHGGTITTEAAKAKAEREYEHYRALLDSQPRLVDADFEKAVKELKKLPAPSRKKKKS